MKTPNGDILVKKGDIIPQQQLMLQAFSICFIDGGLQEGVVKEIINTFSTKCIYMINNADVRKINRKYKIDGYPMGGQNLFYLKTFKITKLPTKITKKGSKIIIQTLNVKRIILEKMVK